MLSLFSKLKSFLLASLVLTLVIIECFLREKQTYVINIFLQVARNVLHWNQLYCLSKVYKIFSVDKTEKLTLLKERAAGGGRPN